MNLSEISIKRPVFAWMLMAGLIVFGGIAFMRMGINCPAYFAARVSCGAYGQFTDLCRIPAKFDMGPLVGYRRGIYGPGVAV